MSVEEIVTTNLADEIAFRIEEGILTGLYPPGSRLMQAELCERFGVSRTPVREALRKLQARNLLIVVPNRGVTVRVPSSKELLDSYSIRGELEGYACELVVERDAVADIIEDLEATQRDIVQLAAEMDPSGSTDQRPLTSYVEMNRLNEEFHSLIHRASGNERLVHMIRDLATVFPKDLVWRATQSSSEFQALNCDEHGEILAALANRRPRRAREAMRSHILHSGRVLMAYCKERGFWDDR